MKLESLAPLTTQPGLQASRLLMQPSDSSMARCFTIPEEFTPQVNGWMALWQVQYGDQPLSLSAVQQEALATVLPILLCGEQSAIAAFHSAAQPLQGQARSASLRLFQTIALDEFQHDLGLSRVQSKLPVLNNLPAVRRKAQLFFARLGRCQSTAAHFARIASLDSGVAIIMRALEGGSIGRDDQLRVLFRQIKRDEARHVFISRNHAFRLGLPRDEYEAGESLIRTQLVELLRPFAQQFAQLGVDADALFNRLGRSKAQ